MADAQDGISLRVHPEQYRQVRPHRGHGPLQLQLALSAYGRPMTMEGFDGGDQAARDDDEGEGVALQARRERFSRLRYRQRTDGMTELAAVRRLGRARSVLAIPRLTAPTRGARFTGEH